MFYMLKITKYIFTCDSYTGMYCWEHVLAMAILSVCPSVSLSIWGVTTRYWMKPRSDRDSGFSPYDSLESLVSNEVIWFRWVRRFPSNEGIKEGYPLRNRNFTTIGWSSVRTVADRHKLAAYHNKHCWRAFRRYQHRWPGTTLNPKIWVFSEFFAILACDAHSEWIFAEITSDRPRQLAYEIKLMLSRISLALAQISC